MQNNSQTKKGIILALGAYIIWGITPIYFKAVNHISAFEILSHRVIWSFVLLTIIVGFTKNWYLIRCIFREKKKLILLLVTSVLIATNWLVYIFAINANQMLDASLGYYINPLLNVLLGMIFLKEKLRPFQWVAVILATFGVLIQLIIFGSIPVIAIILAATFGFYGLLRKKINVNGVAGLFIETLFLFPIALIYLLFIANSETSNFFKNPFSLNLLLIFSGIITTAPLLCFVGAASRLRLSTLGFIQYIGPSIMFMLAIFIYHESFTFDKAITFTCIWGALILFTVESIYYQSTNKRDLAKQ